jgi:hypothetical protein
MPRHSVGMRLLSGRGDRRIKQLGSMSKPTSRRFSLASMNSQYQPSLQPLASRNLARQISARVPAFHIHGTGRRFQNSLAFRVTKEFRGVAPEFRGRRSNASILQVARSDAGNLAVVGAG